jgi:hypothetical protein
LTARGKQNSSREFGCTLSINGPGTQSKSALRHEILLPTRARALDRNTLASRCFLTNGCPVAMQRPVLRTIWEYYSLNTPSFVCTFCSDLSLLGELGAGAWTGITSGERAKGARPIKISRILDLKLHFHQRRSWAGLFGRSIAPSLACDSAPRSGPQRRGKGRDLVRPLVIFRVQ